MNELFKYLKNVVGMDVEEDENGNISLPSSVTTSNTTIPNIPISTPILVSYSGAYAVSGTCSNGINNTTIGYPSGSYNSHLHSNLSGIQGGSVYYSYPQSSVFYTPEDMKEQRRKQLKSELENDPELLNDILADMRKDKIEKIRNKGGF